MSLDLNPWYASHVGFHSGSTASSIESSMMMQRHAALRFTHPLPYGAIVHDGGVQFVVFSRTATAMRVLLYDKVDDPEPAEIIDFDPDLNRWGDVWSIFVPGIGARAALPLPGRRALRARSAAIASIPQARLIDPYCQGPGRRFPAGRRRHRPAAQVRGRRRRVRLAGRPPPAPQPVRDDHLRDARPRLHPVAHQRGRASRARTWA